MRRRLEGVLLVLVLASVPASAADEVDTLIEGARRVDPALVALEAQRDAAKVRRAQAGTLVARNPELELGAGARTTATARSLELDVGLSQELELFGQRGARIDARTAELASLEAGIVRERARVDAEVRVAYARLLRERARVLLEEQAKQNAEQALRAAHERHRAGSGTALERNAARLQLANASRAVLDARAARFAAATRLALLAGRSEEEVARLKGTLTDPAAPWLTSPPATTPGTSAVAAARADLEAARAEERGAKAEVFPPIAVGARYAREEEANIVIGTLALPLPLFVWNQGARATAAARVRGAEAALARAERSAAPAASAARERYEAARAAVELFDAETLKAASENLELGTQAYSAGKLSFPELLLIRADALELRRAYLEAVLTLAEAHAELSRVVTAGQ